MRILRGALLLAAMAVGPSALGASFFDTVGDVAVGSFPHLDVSSVQVSNTSTDLVFKLNLNGDPVATDWGKYMVGIDSTAGGDTAGNGWGRPISMSSGMDFWLGSWVDGGNGMELRNWDGAAWQLQAASYNANLPTPTKDTSSVTLTVPLAYLGLSAGSTFTFDVYSSGGGGGDSAVDAAGNLAVSIANWGDAYNSGTNVLSYTVVPEPASVTLLGLAGLAVLGIVRRRK
jgi:hypothetical protein